LRCSGCVPPRCERGYGHPGMDSVVGIVSAGAVLLVIAGAQKMIDPWPAVAALRQTRVPSHRVLVRAGAAIEIMLASLFLVAGTAVLSIAIAAVYVGFAGFVVIAMRAGVDGSCGCFGREDTPPSSFHVLANGIVAVSASLYATGDAVAPVDLYADISFAAVALAGSTAVLAVVLVAVYSVAPRTLAAARLHRS
jgi:hypothetical protein